MSESQVVNSCIRWLLLKGVLAWRNNTGAFKTEKGQYISFGKKGSSDIIGVLKGGKFLAVECKFGKGKLSPEQISFKEEIEAREGVYIVAYSIDDLERELAIYLTPRPF